MSPNRRRAGDAWRASAEPEQAWAPDLPADHSYRLTLLLSERARYIQRLDYDERERLVEWAVIQSRLINGRWQRVAVYDICHGKGVHVHLFNRREEEFTEVCLRSVTSYKDVEDGLDYVVDRVVECWQENERRSDRGY
jgi:hypothetical protein